MGKAIEKFSLIKENDRIMVAVSGGKDSLSMLLLLREFQKKAPVHFEIFAFTLDQAQPGFSPDKLKNFYENIGIEHYIEKEDTYSIVTSILNADQTYCSLCSRLRRGILYSYARKSGANKLALGHHADDAIETLFLNLMYSGRLASMPPVLMNEAESCIVIRPMIFVDEKDLQELAEELNLPVIPCNLCGSQDNLQRRRVKAWIKEEEKQNKFLKSSLKKALTNVQPAHLWDADLTDFQFSLKPEISI